MWWADLSLQCVALASMSVLKDTLAILWVVVMISQMSQGVNNTIKHAENGYLHCSIDRACPTWFFCNSETVSVEMDTTMQLYVMIN